MYRVKEGCLPTQGYNDQCSVREQSQVQEQENTLPEALWFRRNNSCIPPLPLELWYQRYQRAAHWFRQALSETPNLQPDHISAGLLITPLPPGLTHMPWKGSSSTVWQAPRFFHLLHTSVLLYGVFFPMSATATCMNTIIVIEMVQPEEEA